jgi:FkbM family methyltransferase
MYVVVMKFDDLKTSAISMGWFAVKRRNPALITRDRQTGGWRQRFRQGVLISDNPRGFTWKMCQENTQELILREYTPGPGGVVVEIGSGVGTETVILSRLVGPTGRVIACEAAPRSAELLRATVEANSMSNVEVVEVAVADKPGSIEMVLRGDSDIRNSIFVLGDTEKTTSVPTVTLDDLMADLKVDHIDMLKSNIEGAEGARHERRYLQS